MNKEPGIKLLSNIIAVSGIFLLIVSILLIFNFWQISTRNPLESESLNVLVERLAQEPDNDGLKQEIRDIDLLARKAYFNSLWQVNTGGVMLLIGGIVFIVSLRLYYATVSKIEKPDSTFVKETILRTLSQRSVLLTTGVLLTLGLLSAFFTRDHFETYNSETTALPKPDAEKPEQVEIIEIKPLEDTATVPDSLAATQQQTDTFELQIDTISDKPKEEIIKYPTAKDIYNNYSSFRGPFSNGLSYKNNSPVDWDGATGKNIKWKVQTPKNGYNSPVLWDEKLFVSGADKYSELVVCYNRKSGKLIWKTEIKNIPGSPSSPPQTTNDTGLAAPTLATDGQRVYAIFATGNIVGLDINGNILWSRNLGVPDNHYGHSSSLIAWQDKVFVQFDSNNGGKVLALNVLTGETVWKTKRNSRISWASPILVKSGGSYQLILSGVPIVAGYNIETGAELWSVSCLSGEVGPSPAYSNGIIYAANEYATLTAINISTAKIIWEGNEYLPEVASPAVADGLLFIATSYGSVACHDAKTGELYWDAEFGQGFYSSPIISGNKVYMFDMAGVAHIFEVSKEKKEVAKPALGEKVVSTPAFMYGRLYIRGEKYLYCIGE